MEFLRKLFGGPPQEAGTPDPGDNQRLERLRDRMSAQQHDLSSAPRPERPEAAIPAVPAGPLPRPVVIARKARVRGRDWTRDPSWFGGLPRLGGAA